MLLCNLIHIIIAERQKELTKLESEIEDIERNKSENMNTVENLEKLFYRIEMNILSKLSKHKDENSPEIVQKLNKLHKMEQLICLKVLIYHSI